MFQGFQFDTLLVSDSGSKILVLVCLYIGIKFVLHILKKGSADRKQADKTQAYIDRQERRRAERAANRAAYREYLQNQREQRERYKHVEYNVKL